MFLRLLFVLTFIPFLEIYFLIQINDSIGFPNTILLIMITGVLGAWLLRKQGHSILMEIQKNTQQNQMPSDAISKGFFIFIGGLLLLTPGILTDVIGLSLIFPLTQILWKKFFVGQWQQGIQSGSVQFYSSQNFGDQGPNPFEQQTRSSLEIDADVIDVTAKDSQTVGKKED